MLGAELVLLLLCCERILIHSISLIYVCVLFLAVNVGLFPLRAASSASSAAQAPSWVRHHEWQTLKNRFKVYAIIGIHTMLIPVYDRHLTL